MIHTTAILLMAHGSRRASANDDLRALAETIAGGDETLIVEPSYLELAEPDIFTAGGRCVERGADRVLMIPYFLSAGIHLQRDLAAARDELAERHPGATFVLGRALGPDPLLVELVQRRIAELSNVPPSTAGPERET